MPVVGFRFVRLVLGGPKLGFSSTTHGTYTSLSSQPGRYHFQVLQLLPLIAVAFVAGGDNVGEWYMHLHQINIGNIYMSPDLCVTVVRNATLIWPVINYYWSEVDVCVKFPV